MRTFFPTTRSNRRPATERSLADRPRLSRTQSPARRQVAAQDGFLLIEVIISAFLVGTIVVATLAGFGIVDRSTTASRDHSEAAILAAESQEALRTDPASAFVKLAQSPYEYSRTISGIKYTITQSASFMGAEKGSGTCSATETTRKSTNAVRIASTVSWTEPNTTPKPVTESGIITPPTGSALEVDVANGAPGTIGTAGATAIVTYTPTEATSPATIQGTTGTAGCIVFGGIPATSATVEIPEENGYVIPTGKLHWLTKPVEIAPNLTTHYLVPFARGGNIEAHFTYENSPEYLGKHVEGDTFVVANQLMNEAPDFEVGSHRFKYEPSGEEVATAEPSEFVSAAATTPAATKYSTGDLFPFPESEWEVYAGDCPENNAAIVTKGTVPNGHGTVAAGERAVINVPMSLLTLNVYEGTGPKSSKALSNSKPYPVTITNLGCANTTPNNETAITIKHTQETSPSGHLEHFFQPFGKEFELCLQDTQSGVKRLDRVKYSILTANSSAPSIYLGQLSEAERTEVANEAANKEKELQKAREAEENPAWETLKTKEKALATQKGLEETSSKAREASETGLKTAQANEEATNKADETTEASERSAWETAEKKGKPKLKKTEREAKETAQTAARNTRHAKEATNAATRKTEETKLHEQKTKEEGTSAARIKEEAAAAKTRGELAATRTTREGKEKETQTARITREAAEKAEASSEVTVETGIKC